MISSFQIDRDLCQVDKKANHTYLSSHEAGDDGLAS